MATAVFNPQIQAEISRLSEVKSVDANILQEFAHFIINSYKHKDQKSTNRLKMAELKQAIYNRFDAKNTKELKKSGSFRMAIDGMAPLDLRLKSTWEMLYRKFVGILPSEEDQQGYGCINGINIFNYFKPWQVFGLDSRTATKNDIKKAYYLLSKIYHPDNHDTGDRNIFERLEIMYKSILAGA